MIDSASRHGAKLIICPTPLGNLGDMTQRALQALRDADVVCAEDTRVTGKLLAAFHIKKHLVRMDEATISTKAPLLLKRIAKGEVVAFCSDAGMPGVSDPGMRLIRAARAQNLAVEVLPGPSAAVTAYVASGSPNTHFYFGGFFPRKNAERQRLLELLGSLDAALIFYESPKRLVAALGVIAQVFPGREISVCRELTKVHEEVLRNLSGCLFDEFTKRLEPGGSGVKGEIVIVIDGPGDEEQAGTCASPQEIAKLVQDMKKNGVGKKDIMRTLIDDFGIARNKAYEWTLSA